MTPALRRLALTTHVTASVGWLGAVVVFLGHAAIGVTSGLALVVLLIATVLGLYKPAGLTAYGRRATRQEGSRH